MTYGITNLTVSLTIITDCRQDGCLVPFLCLSLIGNFGKMDAIKNLETVNDYCQRYHRSAMHPLVSVIDLGKETN